MKLNTKDALSSIQSLRMLGQKNLPMQVSITIAGNIRAFRDVSEEYEKRRKVLVESMGEKDEQGNMTVKEENLDAFQGEMESLLNEPVEISVKTVSLGDFPEGFDVEPNMLVDLGWLITMEGQKPTHGKRKNK